MKSAAVLSVAVKLSAKLSANSTKMRLYGYLHAFLNVSSTAVLK